MNRREFLKQGAAATLIGTHLMRQARSRLSVRNGMYCIFSAISTGHSLYRVNRSIRRRPQHLTSSGTRTFQWTAAFPTTRCVYRTALF
jgi:hypothetical protein